MHAIVIDVTVDPNREADATRMLREMIVPKARAHAGFVASNWLPAQQDNLLRSVHLTTRSTCSCDGDSNRRSTTGAPVNPQVHQHLRGARLGVNLRPETRVSPQRGRGVVWALRGSNPRLLLVRHHRPSAVLPRGKDSNDADRRRAQHAYFSSLPSSRRLRSGSPHRSRWGIRHSGRSSICQRARAIRFGLDAAACARCIWRIA